MIDVQSKVTTDERYAQQVGIYETLQVLCGGIEALNDDVQRLSNESLQQSILMKTTSQSLAMLKISVEESNVSLNAFNTNMTILQQDYLSLKQNVEESQSTSYNGILIWKIAKVQEKMSKNINIFI
jgi:hypothetical protein